MLSIIQQAGWPIWPLLVLSVFALAIIIERIFSLRSNLVFPSKLLGETIAVVQAHAVDNETIESLRTHSALGRVLSAGVKAAYAPVPTSDDKVQEAMADAGRVVAHDLNRFIPTLATISTIAPLLGLLGTVIGMIELFAAHTPGSNNPEALGRGISIALYNTAAGLLIAIPSNLVYRILRNKVDELVLSIEIAATRLAEEIRILRVIPIKKDSK